MVAIVLLDLKFRKNSFVHARKLYKRINVDQSKSYVGSAHIFFLQLKAVNFFLEKLKVKESVAIRLTTTASKFMRFF